MMERSNLWCIPPQLHHRSRAQHNRGSSLSQTDAFGRGCSDLFLSCSKGSRLVQESLRSFGLVAVKTAICCLGTLQSRIRRRKWLLQACKHPKRSHAAPSVPVSGQDIDIGMKRSSRSIHSSRLAGTFWRRLPADRDSPSS